MKEKQLTILKMKLETGKVKNKYAIINKIKQLEKELNKSYKSMAWNNFLAQ